jgi:hypothetical protein
LSFPCVAAPPDAHGVAAGPLPKETGSTPLTSHPDCGSATCVLLWLAGLPIRKMHLLGGFSAIPKFPRV